MKNSAAIWSSIVVLVVIIITVGIIISSNNSSNSQTINNSNSSSMRSTTSSTQSTQAANTGLIIEDLKVGDGTEVKSGQSATFHYTGTLEDGTKFDSSLDRGVPFTTKIGVGQVIAGWDQGIPGMKIGGKRKLTIPGNLAYGSRGIPQAGILPNATLLFEVELLSIQ